MARFESRAGIQAPVKSEARVRGPTGIWGAAVAGNDETVDVFEKGSEVKHCNASRLG